MDSMHVVQKTTVTVEKKPLALVFPYLGSMSLQTRKNFTKLLKTSSVIVNCKQCSKIRPDQVTTFI